MSALGQPRPGDIRSFIKFDAWSILNWPLIARAFPEVPSIFLGRERSEIIASHSRQPGAYMAPQLIDPALFGIDRGAALHIPREDYMSRVLDAIDDAAAELMEKTGAPAIAGCGVVGAAGDWGLH